HRALAGRTRGCGAGQDGRGLSPGRLAGQDACAAPSAVEVSFTAARAAAGLSGRTGIPGAGPPGSQRPWRDGSVREPGAGGPDEKANHVLDQRGSRRDGAVEGPASQRRIAGVAGPATVGTGPGPDEDVAPGSEGGPRELHGRMAA